LFFGSADPARVVLPGQALQAGGDAAMGGAPAFSSKPGNYLRSLEQATKGIAMSRVLAVLLAFVVSVVGCPLAMADTAPPVMLANVYHPGIVLDDYWVSEKYDGVRGYWDGEKLRTRSGATLHPPAWFTAGWPALPLDGELWAGRGAFDEVSATVRQQPVDDAAWRRVRYMVFDLPAHPGPFTERLAALKKVVDGLDLPWVQWTPQAKVASEADLEARLDRVVRQGGEGLMLHRGASPYRAGRNDDLLKLKPYDDAEARVIAHLPGKGKYTGMMGALLVETPEGVRFRLGMGFKDEQRRHPPPIGSLVTYRYRGTTSGGKPRFASFVRIRDDS
jgi:DNA ligase-1